MLDYSILNHDIILVMKKIPLRNIKGISIAHALVDDEDFIELNKHSWHLNAGYATRNIRVTPGRKGKHKSLLLHRVIANTPKDLLTDQINGNKLDNRRCNLRYATKSQNAANTPIRKVGVSGYRGVHLHKRTAKWVANIKIDKKTKNLGYYASAREAADIYDKAALIEYGEFAVFNNPVID